MKTFRCLAIACVALTVGCSSEPVPDGSGSTAIKANQSEGGSFDSPEAVFTAFSQAMDQEDWQSAIPLVTDETKEMFVMGMVMQASFMTMEDESKGSELEQLFKKHGLDESLMEGPGAEEPNLNEMIADLPAFVGELADWIKANSEDSEDGFPKVTKISDVKIEGETATALAETEMGPQPIEFQKEDGQWKVNLAMGPPPEPSLDELGIDFDELGEGTIGSMQVNDKSSALNHAFAYHAKFFDEPCINLVLSAEEVSEEKQNELQQELKEKDGDAIFFAEGPNVTLRISPEGEMLSVFAWIDNNSISSSRGPALDVEIDDNTIRGRVGQLPDDVGADQLQFKAKFETEIRF
jgi:hypothetical protein